MKTMWEMFCTHQMVPGIDEDTETGGLYLTDGM